MLLTVENVGRILDLYAASNPERGPSEVAAELGMTKSKAHLLMSSMAQIGLLRRLDGGRYRIGWRALELDRLATEASPFRPLARAMALRLARHCGEMIHVGVLDMGRVVYIERIRGAQAVDVRGSSVGSTLPAHCTGVGKLLLAHLAAAEVDAILDQHGMPALTPNTMTERDTLYAELHRIRRDEVAYDREEVQIGLSCVAAPIFDLDGIVVAAMSISAPTDRLHEHGDDYRKAIERAAQGVTRQLRHPGPSPVPASARPPAVTS